MRTRLPRQHRLQDRRQTKTSNHNLLRDTIRHSSCTVIKKRSKTIFTVENSIRRLHCGYVLHRYGETTKAIFLAWLFKPSPERNRGACHTIQRSFKWFFGESGFRISQGVERPRSCHPAVVESGHGQELVKVSGFDEHSLCVHMFNQSCEPGRSHMLFFGTMKKPMNKTKMM